MEGCVINRAAISNGAASCARAFPTQDRMDGSRTQVFCRQCGCFAPLSLSFYFRVSEGWTNLPFWAALWLYSILHVPLLSFIYIRMYENFLNTMLQVFLILLVLESSKTHNAKAQGYELYNNKKLHPFWLLTFLWFMGVSQVIYILRTYLTFWWLYLFKQ